MNTVPPSVPVPLTLADALGRSQPLQLLRRRIADSNARFAIAAKVIPQALHAQLCAGSLDEQSWTILACSASAAAKLRQMLPRIEDECRCAGWPALAVRIQVRR
jgi:hypothetical protein